MNIDLASCYMKLSGMEALKLPRRGVVETRS